MTAPPFRLIGKSPKREDGPQQASGLGVYADDLKHPGLLNGAIVRVGRPHARILRIDTSRAQRERGVACVLTGRDIPHNLYGPTVMDQPVLCTEKIRYEEDPVVALCAESWGAAQGAARKVCVDYEDHPPVTDAAAALRPGSPLVHEAHPTGNLTLTFRVRRGDVESGFAEADLIVVERFRTQPQEHAYMEPHVCLAEAGADGKLILHVSTQGPFTMRENLVRVLGLPISRIRVICCKVGGAFGGKYKIMLEILAALCAMRTGRPVKFRMTREESLAGPQRKGFERFHRERGEQACGRRLISEILVLAKCPN